MLLSVLTLACTPTPQYMEGIHVGKYKSNLDRITASGHRMGSKIIVAASASIRKTSKSAICVCCHSRLLLISLQRCSHLIIMSGAANSQVQLLAAAIATADAAAAAAAAAAGSQPAVPGTGGCTRNEGSDVTSHPACKHLCHFICRRRSSAATYCI